jgi:hypothetical protein
MQLRGNPLERLHSALLKRFPDTDGLMDFVQVKSPGAAGYLAQNAPPVRQLTQLIQYAENRNLTGALIRFAGEANPQVDLLELQWQYDLLQKLETAIGSSGNVSAAVAAKAYTAAWPERERDPWALGDSPTPLDYAWHLIEAHILCDNRIPLLPGFTHYEPVTR